MRLWTIWFWITAFLALIPTALGSVNSSITRFYHPLIAENYLLFEVRVFRCVRRSWNYLVAVRLSANLHTAL